MAHCHCSMCRKFHGSAFSTFAEVKRDCFGWLIGKELLVDYVADNGTMRQFCKICGSSMTFKPADHSGNSIEIALGTLDPNSHIE